MPPYCQYDALTEIFRSGKSHRGFDSVHTLSVNKHTHLPLTNHSSGIFLLSTSFGSSSMLSYHKVLLVSTKNGLFLQMFL